MAALVKLFKGARYRSKFLDKASFSSYLDKIPDARSPFAWLSRDDEQIALYEKDPPRVFDELLKLFAFGAGEKAFRLLYKTSLLHDLLPEIAEFLDHDHGQDSIL